MKWNFKILVLSLAVLQVVTATICFAQNQNIYRNSKGHFSFTVPAGWEEIPKDVIDEYLKTLEGLSDQPLEVRYEAGFQKVSKNYFTYPYILIQLYQDRRYPEDELQRYFTSKKGKESMQEEVQKVEIALPGLVQNMEMGQPVYDRKRHTLFTKLESDVTGAGEVLGIIAGVLGNEGMVSMSFYSGKDNYQSDLTYFNQIINSFSYDKGYEYQKTTDENLPLFWKIIINIIIGIIFVEITRKTVWKKRKNETS